MGPGFGFSVGDFIAAIQLCTKVAKALKESGAAAADYQQVVLELQGLQNVLTRLVALEPTESNIQHVNAIRAAALASTLPLQEFLSKLSKFEQSMSPFAAKKSFSVSKVGRQTQYAVLMADDIKNMRAVIYGSVIRINVLLATHASEALSRNEERLSIHHAEVTTKLQATRDEMSLLIDECTALKSDLAAHRDEARVETGRSAGLVQDLSSRFDTNSAAHTQALARLSGTIGTLATSVSSIRDLASQIVSLLRVIPTELGEMIQNVLRSNARIESTLLSMDQKMTVTPSLLLETNIRLEDALGRIHADIPFEWFQYWETFEGLLKARFKDTPGREKIDHGGFRLVHAKRPSIYLDKNSWSGSITPGAQLVMLMIITNVAFRNTACPRRSCDGQIFAKARVAALVTCPQCGLRFIPQMATAADSDGDEVARLQRIEDDKLFGEDVMDDTVRHSDLSRRILDVTEDVEMMNVSETARMGPSVVQPPSMLRTESTLIIEGMNVEESVQSASKPPWKPNPPIMSWLSQTVPPRDPSSVREWRDAAETEQLKFKEREARDLEVFRNVQIEYPPESEAPGLIESSPPKTEEKVLAVGAHIFYRNILDRYPHIEPILARRLATSNWQRQQRLKVMQSEVERSKIRAKSRKSVPEGGLRRKVAHSKRQSAVNEAEKDLWEGIDVDVDVDADDDEGGNRQQTEEPMEWSIQRDPPTQTTVRRRPRHEFVWGLHGRPKGAGSRAIPDGTASIQPQFSPWSTLPDEMTRKPVAQTSLSPLNPPFDIWSLPSPTSPASGEASLAPPMPKDLPLPTLGQEFSFPCYDVHQRFEKTKERRICNLPPLPSPLPSTQDNTSANLMICYLCHAQVHIDRKKAWRSHVMDDLHPYVCPVVECLDPRAVFSRRAGLLRHITISHTGAVVARCPFCDLDLLPDVFEGRVRACMKHLGHHMEEIAFGVVSTAYENWSYDESGSDIELADFRRPKRPAYPMRLPPSNDFGPHLTQFNPDFFLHDPTAMQPLDTTSQVADGRAPTQPSQDDAIRESFTWLSMPLIFDDTQFEENFWTGDMVATSSASSANSGLREPHPAEFFEVSSPSSISELPPLFAVDSPDDRRQPSTSQRTKGHKGKAKGKHRAEKRVGRHKGPLLPEQRKQASEIRKLRACLRCKFLRKSCDASDPCTGCTGGQPGRSVLWQTPCTRKNIEDLGYFLKDWNADCDRYGTIGFSDGKGDTFSSTHYPALISHGYGHYVPITVREVFPGGQEDLEVSWVETKKAGCDFSGGQYFQERTSSYVAISDSGRTAAMMEYLDKHIDDGFEDFVDRHFDGTPFLTECLKTAHRYYLGCRPVILRNALRVLLAYNLTLSLTLLEDVIDDNGVGRVSDPSSKLCGQVIAPVRVNFEIKACLAAIWRYLHEELLEELDALYSSVYSGDKLKHWGSIFFVSLVLLAVWEEMQFDCHYRVPDTRRVQRFCDDMENVPVAVLVGMFAATSSKVPPILDWDTSKHGHLFGHDVGLTSALSEMRIHVTKYESYLRSRPAEAKFDRDDFDSLSNKFLAKLIFRDRWLGANSPIVRNGRADLKVKNFARFRNE